MGGINDIQTILVANRGEIAVRVMRTARSLGLRSVAVYSDADANSLHVTSANDAVHIGPSPASESYLSIEKILNAAKVSGADAIHPGYGFLSENAEFAQAVEKTGMVFIGPTAKAITLMGNKAEAKRHMIAAGVSCVPGYEGEKQDDATLVKEGVAIGFPLMVKAAAGGGGRGMRLVHNKKELAESLASARAEAENAFASGELILEKAIIEPRHVEFQVFADSHGQVIHLGERDCSVQRRHQKVIEEAPCPVMTPQLRERMGATAVEATRSIGYRGAGTVEFLLDSEGEFYFLEMNTRLQVEHPVTEEVTGLDLVALQIKVARGEHLGLTQEDIALNGHSIEVRLYAENPYNQFLPSTGRVALWRPGAGEGLRYDDGIASGQEVSPFYDPMIAKVVGTGPTREVARKRLISGLQNTVLFGPHNNRDFLVDCLSRKRFIAGQATTAFIAQEFGEGELTEPAPEPRQLAALAVLHYLADREQMLNKALYVPKPLLNFNAAVGIEPCYHLSTDAGEYRLIVHSTDSQHYRVNVDETQIPVTVVAHQQDEVLLDIGGTQSRAVFMLAGPSLFACIDGQSFVCRNLLTDRNHSEDADASGRIVAPLHGQVTEVFVKDGDKVDKDDRLAIIEAMKMQHSISAEVGGKVVSVAITPGQQVATGDVLMEIEVSQD